MADEQIKRYHSISEVAEMTGLKTHILRFWESEFPLLRPRKNRAGNRAYTSRDIKIVKHIKHILYEEKHTIKGAKERLKVDRELFSEQLKLPLKAADNKSKEIEEIRNDLHKLISMVEEL